MPYPARHRDYFSAKEPGPMTGWLRRVTFTNTNRRAVIGKSFQNQQRDLDKIL
jgi:hypothetical protein